MKRILPAILILALFTCFFAGCKKSSENRSADTDKISIVTTIFPAYDFARAVAGDSANVTMLLPPGAESHSFEPTPQDIIKIKNADIFIYNGGDSDAWISSILETLDTSKLKIVSMMDQVSVVEEEVKEGMQDEDHGHSHGAEAFNDDEVKDRTLSDWEGDWQSIYPYLTNGALDEVMKHKAEDSEDGKTATDYYNYYLKGYKTDVERIVISGDNITFYKNGKPSTSKYIYKGYKIFTYESGDKGVRYQFEAESKNGAPKYIQFSDHMIAPERAEHFHLYTGNNGFDALSKEMENWPTYFLSGLTGAEIAAEMLHHDHSHEDKPEYDEHVWTSPLNAIVITEAISKTLNEVDPLNQDVYTANAAAYITKLKELDAAFRDLMKNAKRKTIVFGDRFPLRYFVDTYGLDYYAAFPGCSTESEANARTVAFLIDKVKKDKIPVVFTIELSSGKIADTIVESTGAEKLVFNTCHNVTKDELAKGSTYVELMKNNLEKLKKAVM